MGLFGPPDVKKMEASGDAKGLMKALGNDSVGHKAARALADMGADPAPLVAGISEGSERRSLNCRNAVLWLGPSAVPALAAALRGPDLNQRRTAAEILGKIGDPLCVEPLIAALSDEATRLRAADALNTIGEHTVNVALRGQSDDVRRVVYAAMAEDAAFTAQAREQYRAATRCKAYRNGSCIIQGRDTGPCSGNPDLAQLCHVVIENKKYGTW
jgi:hypothetical protein